MKKISAVVVNYHREEVTRECIKSLVGMDKADFDFSIIVVDSQSQGKLIKGAEVIACRQNTGFAGGANIGIKRALAEGAGYVFLINNDTLVKKDFLIKLFECIEKANADIATGKIYFAPGFEYLGKYQKKDRGRVIWYAGGHINWNDIMGVHDGVDEVDPPAGEGRYDTQRPVEFISGCCMLIKKDVFAKIGFFDEKYFLYLEDLDFCWRAQKNGLALIYCPRAVMWHKNLGTKPGKDSYQQYYYYRNRLLFGFKYSSFRTKAALIRESVRKLISGHALARRGVIDFYLGRFGEKN